jgi:rod shape-determining protein MreB
MAAAIGARIPVQDAGGNMIVDIGGGTTEIAVLSLGGIVSSKSLRIAGDGMNEDIIKFARDKFNLLIGERTAENVKIAIGSSHAEDKEMRMKIRGRDLVSGLPKEVQITSSQTREALARSVKSIINAIKATIEETPPELIGDIMSRGIALAGGGTLIRGLDKLITEQTEMPVKRVDDPLTAVVRGTGIVLEDIESLKDILSEVPNRKALN